MAGGKPQDGEVTKLLEAWSNGDRSALDRLVPLVHAELHALAHRFIRRENPGHTLQTTALVNEAFIRLVGQREAAWQNRAQFFAISARIMRRILIDHARSIAYAKRGGGAEKVSLDDIDVVSPVRAAELVRLDEALDALNKVDERKSRVVELRYFGGMTSEEIGHVLGVHPDTVMREWRRAKAYLLQQLQPSS